MRLGLERQNNTALLAWTSVVGCLGYRDAAFTAAVTPQVREDAVRRHVAR